MKRFHWRFVYQWGLGLLLLLLLFLLGDLSQFRLLPDMGWVSVLAVFLCNVFFTVSHNFRWKKIVDDLSPHGRSDFLSLYRSLVDSYAMGKIIPMDVSLLVLRSYDLKRLQGTPISVAVFSVLLDRFLDIVILLVMGLPSFLLITGAASEIQSLSILVFFLIGQGFVIFWKKGETFHFLRRIYRLFLARWLSKIPFLGNRLRGEMGQEEEVGHFSLASVTETMLWNLVKYVFLSLRFYFTGRALGIPFPWLQGFFFLPFIQLSGIINVTPGGLGVLELGTYGALVLMGIPKFQILTFVVGQRILLISMSFALFFFIRIFFLFRPRLRQA